MSTEITPDAVRDQDEAISLSYWLAEKMGEHVDDQGDETLTETVQRYVSREWMPKIGANPTPAPSLLDQDADDDGREAAPLDPSKVKAGDTVALRIEQLDRPVLTLAGETHTPNTGHGVFLGGWRVDDLPDYVTLTAHQPAPEPEPEWLFEFKGEEGPEGDEHWARRFSSRADALRSMITCAHGQTAEDLCNAMPDKVELDAMWTAWKSLTPAEQRGWLEGGEGKVPTPAKVSGSPVATRAQVFDVLYPDGIMPNEDMRDSKIDALMALFGGAR
jgi:hypothetical protein